MGGDRKPPRRPGVGLGVFVLRDGKILMIRRTGAHGEGTWSVPGGHLEFGESLEAGALREVAEETGLTVSTPEFLCCTNDYFADEGKHYLTVFLQCEHVAGEPRPLQSEMTEMGWFSPAALPEPLFFPLQNLRAGKHYGSPTPITAPPEAVVEPSRDSRSAPRSQKGGVGFSS